jgi:hypothetical protein
MILKLDPTSRHPVHESTAGLTRTTSTNSPTRTATATSSMQVGPNLPILDTKNTRHQKHTAPKTHSRCQQLRCTPLEAMQAVPQLPGRLCISLTSPTEQPSARLAEDTCRIRAGCPWRVPPGSTLYIWRREVRCVRNHPSRATEP